MFYAFYNLNGRSKRNIVFIDIFCLNYKRSLFSEKNLLYLFFEPFRFIHRPNLIGPKPAIYFLALATSTFIAFYLVISQTLKNFTRLK
jgi:hypothetical protein